MQCKKCGADLKVGDSFCMNCGAACEVVVAPVQNTVPVGSVQETPMVSMNSNPNNNKKMYLIIAGIILVAVIMIIIVLYTNGYFGSSKSKQTATSNSNSNVSSNTNMNTNSNSSSNSIFNSNTNSNITTNSNSNENTEKVSGGIVEFNEYQFMIPNNYEAEVEHWEYLGDVMMIENKENYNSFDVEVESTSYSEIKAKPDALKEEISSGDYYMVGTIQYKNYGGKEYMVISRTSKSTGLVHMIAYVALNDSETIVIDATNSDYDEDYELFQEIAPIIASAKK